MGLLQRWGRRRRGECVICGTKLGATELEEIRGRSESAVIALRGVPVLACRAADHPRRWADPEFGLVLTEQIFNAGEVPVSRTRGPRRRACWKCGAPLTGRALTRVHVEGIVRVEGLNAFTVALEAPGTRCEQCGEEQVDASAEVSNDVSNALAAAFDAAALEP